MAEYKIETILEERNLIGPFCEHHVIVKYPNGKHHETYSYKYDERGSLFLKVGPSPMSLEDIMTAYGLWWQDKGIRMERQRHGVIF